jgi:putative flippase GtrA
MALQAPALYTRIRPMLPEFLKFCLIGGIGMVIDLGGAGVLHASYHVEPLAAKAVSVTAATVFTYAGSRFWTFKHRENQSVRREAALFFVLNVAGLLIAEAVLGVVIYVLGMRSTFDYNVASVIGSGLGTMFRFYAYRKWVFLAPQQPAAAAEAVPGAAEFPDYPPWELDPAYLAAEAVTARVPVASYSSPWQQEPATAARQQEPASAWATEPALATARGSGTDRAPAQAKNPQSAARTAGRHRKG